VTGLSSQEAKVQSTTPTRPWHILSWNILKIIKVLFRLGVLPCYCFPPVSSSDPPFILYWGSLDSLSLSTSSHHGEKRPVMFLSSSISSIRRLGSKHQGVSIQTLGGEVDGRIEGVVAGLSRLMMGTPPPKKKGAFIEKPKLWTTHELR
jgi:hypothetical protein